MSQSRHAEMPTAKSHPSHWRPSVIWVVPLVAALVAGFLVFQRVREFGSTITISFRDAEGVRPGQTPIQYRGAAVGEVSAVALSKDQRSVTVTVKLRRYAAEIAREGATFWIVRPQLGMGNFTGLGTIVTGPYIAVTPGQGKVTKEFTGVEDPPAIIDPNGLRIVLLAADAGSLRAGVPLYYRGIEVGAVSDTKLSTNAAAVEIHCVVRHRYAPLVRADSKFWNVTGMDVRLGLFKGAEVNVESLKSLLIGGIAFATPTESKGNASEGSFFRLYEQAEKEWLAWSPRIVLPPEEVKDEKPSNVESSRSVGFPAN